MLLHGSGAIFRDRSAHRNRKQVRELRITKIRYPRIGIPAAFGYLGSEKFIAGSHNDE
jgi:hypothetical protein